MHYLLLQVIILSNSPAYGLIVPDDSRTLGLACAGIMLADEATAMPNQAALAMVTKRCLSFGAANPFLIPGLASGNFSLCLPSKSGTIQLGFSSNGSGAYQERKIGLAFGKALAGFLRAGIEMDYCTIRQYASFGNLHALLPSLGLQVIPARQLSVGIQLTNPAGQSYYPKGYRCLPQILRAGAGYSPGDGILLCIEYQKESHYRPVYCGGVEYNGNHKISLRVGISSSQMVQYSFGLGFRGDHMRIYMAVCHHPVLGYSPSITMTFIP